MKVLDSTTLIAFLREMDFPEGLERLSKIHQLLVPHAVAVEIKKPPASTRMDELVRTGILIVREAPRQRVESLMHKFIELGPGECECVALWETVEHGVSARIVTDDKRIRIRVPGAQYVWTQELIHYMVLQGLLEDRAAEEFLGRLAASSFYYRRAPDGKPPRNRNPF
jgi:predicted nucleic acid-binding protein